MTNRERVHRIADPPPDVRCLILSGDDGLLLPDEPIGHWERLA